MAVPCPLGEVNSVLNQYFAAKFIDPQAKRAFLPAPCSSKRNARGEALRASALEVFEAKMEFANCMFVQPLQCL